MLENMLIKRFKKHFFKQYPNGFYYNVNECKKENIDEPCGMSDLILNIAQLDLTIYMEVKKYKTLRGATNNLRDTQKETLTNLSKANKLVLLLYFNGCAYLCRKTLTWKNIKDVDDKDFSAFDKIVYAHIKAQMKDKLKLDQQKQNVIVSKPKPYKSLKNIVKTEADLVKEFKNHFSNGFLYVVKETGYGRYGMPDMLLNTNDSDLTLYTEFKKYDTFEEALQNVRPSQHGVMEELACTNKQCLLIYKNGCAFLSRKNIEWVNVKGHPFKIFDLIVKKLSVKTI
jgi:hypothetical protein